METMTRESWTDERLDDLNVRVSEGFARLDSRIDEGLREVRVEMREMRAETNERFEGMERRFEQIDKRFAHMDDRLNTSFGRIDERLDSMARAITIGSFTMSAALVGGIVAVLTAV